MVSVTVTSSLEIGLQESTVESIETSVEPRYTATSLVILTENNHQLILVYCKYYRRVRNIFTPERNVLVDVNSMLACIQTSA